MSKLLTFDPEHKKFILDIFEKTIDNEGYVVEKSDPTQRVFTPDGEEVKFADFAGFIRGSMIFVKSGLVSAVKLADRLKNVSFSR
ncbi:MAG: hypothetical protein L6420_03225 [Elusimicrobia bacterium]|nr:hypothetical protein [Elusimicrobiota bacterium]